MSIINYIVTLWSKVPTGQRTMVVWDAGLYTPISTTYWDNGTTDWIG